MRQRISTATVALCIAIYFFALAGPGLRADFTYDDLLNLYFAWIRTLPDLLRANLFFFSPPTRSLGALFYWLAFHFAGFNPLPYRIVCFLALTANIWLTYCFASRLTGSREIGALASLLHAFHGSSSSLYYNGGTCYDEFCFFFYFTAFIYYMRIRQQGRDLRIWQIAGIACMYVAALNSKEMAVTLPVLIGVYELVYHSGERWFPRFNTTLVSGAITIVYVIGTTRGPDSLTNLPGYKPVISFGSYLAATCSYLNDLIYSVNWFGPGRAVAVLASLLAVAWLTRSTHLKFCWFFLTVGVLPVAFIPPRGLYAVYIPTAALATFLAVFLQKAGRLAGRTPRPVLFALVTACLAGIHVWNRALDVTCFTNEERHIRDVIVQLSRLHPEIGKGSRVLLFKDPFEGRVWDSVFLLRLFYRDNTLVVDRAGMMAEGADPSKYDYVLSFEDGRLLDVDAKGRRKRQTEASAK